MPDPELKAMADVHEALQPLDSEGRERVLRWALAKFEVALPSVPASTPAHSDAPSLVPPSAPTSAFADVGDLVHAAAPAAGPDYALVVAYWLQVIEGRSDWSSAELNSALTDLGHRQTNITATLTRLIRRKPSLVIQTAKSGRSRQARKSYKLSAAGVRLVEEMFSTREESE